MSIKNKFRKFCVLSIAVLIALVASDTSSYGKSIETIIRVGYTGNLPPYQFESNNQLVGFHIDLLEGIAGKYHYKIEYIMINETKDRIEALKNNKIDILLGVCPDQELSKDVNYSDVISESYITIVAANKISEDYFDNSRKHYFIASMEMNTVSYPLVVNMGKTSFLIEKNQRDAFEKMISGDANILIGVRDSVIYQLDQMNAMEDYKIINNYVEPIRYYIAVEKNDKVLLQNINTGLRELRLSGEYDEMYERWVNEQERITKDVIENAVKIILLILIVVAGISVINVRLNRLLKRQVALKTEELSVVNKDLYQRLIEIRENNEIRNKVVDQSPSAIIVIDRELRITLFNEKARELTEVDNDPIGKDIMEIELMHRIFGDKGVFQIEGIECVGREVRILESGYGEQIYRYDIYNLHTEKDDIRGAIFVIDDVTKEVGMKEQINTREKNQLLSQLVAEIAHEILNPLTSIKTLAEIFPSKRNDERFQESFSQIVPTEIDRIYKLLRNLLDYAKPAKANKVWVNISEVMGGCRELMQPMIAHDRIDIMIENEENLWLLADSNQLKQILLNLMINSVESMRERLLSSEERTTRLCLKLWTAKTGLSVYLIVEDQGVGMTAEQIKHATDPFYTTKKNGSGLGLAVTKRLVEENQGTLVIESHKDEKTVIAIKFSREVGERQNGKEEAVNR